MRAGYNYLLEIVNSQNYNQNETGVLLNQFLRLII